jgi:hypothetical protein
MFTPNHCDRVLLVLRLDEFLLRRKRRVEAFDRDSALEATAEGGLDPHGIGKAGFSADCGGVFRFLHGFHFLAIRHRTDAATVYGSCGKLKQAKDVGREEGA